MKKQLLQTTIALSIFACAKVSADPCTNVVTIQCGTTIAFTSTGFGDPNYPNGMNGQGCSSGTAQGGQETVYMFIVPTTGTYQFTPSLGQGINQYVDYYYKDSSTVCNNTGWKCLGRTTANGAVSLDAFNWIAGDTILFLANAEQTNTTTQSFTILCATQVCNSIQNINCNDTVSINVFGHGNPDYPNGMNGQGCSTGTAQGGRELAYSFVVPSNGTYQIYAFNGQGINQNISYYYKDSSTVCSNTDWKCLGQTTANGAVSLDAFNWLVGDTILFLINAEQTNTTTQKFKIVCAAQVCSNIQDIGSCDTIQINVFGHGDPDYPNGMNGQGCGTGTAQGGRELAYRFIPPSATSCTYEFRAFNGQGINQNVSYYYKDSSTVCSNTDWKCLGQTTANGSVSLGAFNWTSNDTILFLINVQQTNTTTQKFTIVSACCSPPSGIQNVYPVEKIRIFPNPSNGIFKIELPEQLNNNSFIFISDVLGNKVQEYKLQQQKYFEVNLNLANGIYILNINSTEIIYRAKLILER